MDEECGDTKCGCQFPWRDSKSRINFKMLQLFANVKFAVVLLCMGNFLNQLVINGLYAMSISTIESRFQLHSSEMGFIAGSYDVFVIFGMMLILVFGEKRHRPIWISLGLIVMGIGCFTFSLPHFIAPSYVPVDESQSETCQNASSVQCTDSSLRNYKYIFAAGLMAFGLGTVTIYAFSVVYIDENTTKALSAIYSAIFFSMGALGPAVGFLGGGATLELYTYIGQEPDGLTSSSYAWIGAWWIGYVFSASALLLVSIFVYMLPRNLPGTEELRKNRNDEMQAGTDLDDAELDKIADSIIKSILYLFRNKCLMLCIFGNALNFAFIYGFNTFGSKYFESQLGLRPFIASIVYGISSIFAGAASQLLSGFLMARYKLNVSQIIKYMLVCSIISACCSFGLLIHCPDINFAGATVPYHENNEYELTSPCNANCTCNTDVYEPVCGADGITYFSPCFAGCDTSYNNGSFLDCNCVGYNISSPLLNETWVGQRHANDGICEHEHCNNIPLIMLCMFVAMFTSLMTFSPSMQVTLRCVPFSLRIRAVSLNRIISYLFGTIPGRVLTGLIIDLACAAWQTECGEQGSCVVYDKRTMARNLSLILLAETWCLVGVYIAMLIVYVPHGNKTEEKTTGKTLLGETLTGPTQNVETTKNDDTP